jgi:CDP-paratose 2-epimerase
MLPARRLPLPGPITQGVELHGFLNYLVKCNLEGKEYKVFGYKGKQGEG